MGKRGREIVGVDVTKLLEELNKALADEWLAYYQYWVGAKIAKGPMRSAVVAELEEHAEEELKHANMLADRILELGGTPIIEPQKWFDMANCPYDPPFDSHVRKLVEQNIEAERCAIDVYKKLIDMVIDKDSITYHIVREILAEEVEHEDDLEMLLEDMDLMKESK